MAPVEETINRSQKLTTFQRSHDLDYSFSANILDIEALESYLSLEKMTALKTSLSDIQSDINQAVSLNRTFVDIKELHHRRIVSAVINFFITDAIQNSSKLIREFEKDANLACFPVLHCRWLWPSQEQCLWYDMACEEVCKLVEPWFVTV